MEERANSIEVSGRNVEDAIAQALNKLGLERDQVDIEVIREGGRSLLGLLREDAVVRVTPRAPARSRPAAPPSHRPQPPMVQEEPQVQAEEDEEEEEEAVAIEAEEVDEELRAAAPAVTPEERAAVEEIGVRVLTELLTRMGIEARVSVEKQLLASQTAENSVLLNVSGDDLGLLIGRRGETLRDLQFMTNLIVSRDLQHWPSLVVDVEHYKARRERTLVETARQMASRVRRNREAITLDPMPPYERRIIHLTLRDDPDVYTESTGQGERRRVMILPRE